MAEDATTMLTIADHAARSKSPAAKEIVKSFLETTNILDDLPLDTMESLTAKGSRITEEGLPDVEWGQINALGDEGKAATQHYEEQVALFRRQFKIDGKLYRQKDWIEDPFDLEFYAAVQAYIYKTNWSFFNNDPVKHGTGLHNKHGWIGVRTRLRNPAKYKVANGLRINCNGLNLKDTMTQADAFKFHEKINQAFAYLGASEGQSCVAYTNWLTMTRAERAVKLMNPGAGFTTTQDNYDRPVTKYRQMKWRDMGFYRGDVTKPILPWTEDANGDDTGAGTHTSIVIVRFGKRHMKGWQDGELKPEYLGRSRENGIYHNAFLDWGCGLCHAHDRSFVELYGIETEGPDA